MATSIEFRRLALAMPEVTESDHMGHPDFRVAGKVFATLGYPDTTRGMVKLPPEVQAVLCDAEPAIFEPVKGAWGRKGATLVRLAASDRKTVASALTAAWRNIAPSRLRD